MTRLWFLGVSMVAALLALGGCGSGGNTPAASATAHGGGSVVFTGDITGTWSKAGDTSESTCGANKAEVHIMGAAEGDEGDLTVKSDGSVFLDAEKYGDFTAASGGTFHANTGFDINSDIATARGKTAHVQGALNC
ncbi:MAG: hypothetical protein E6J45_07170 [Chloroflexi bacterium]|nr:MAG: hypothetical protein E6J45_07170 [Chloroflexota bacterium]